MTPELIASTAGVIISLVVEYVPPVARVWASLTGDRKRAVMGALMVLVGAGAYALACVGWADVFGLPTTCDQRGVAEVVRAVIAALVANQATYTIAGGRR